MEFYPQHLLSHVSPLVFVQGVGLQEADFPVLLVPDSSDFNMTHNQNGETIVRNQRSLVREENTGTAPLGHVNDLVKVWRKSHLDGVVWTSSATKTQVPTHPYRYKFRFISDDHKLPDVSEIDGLSDDQGISGMKEEIISQEWFWKFQALIPALFISFYEAGETSQDDNSLIQEINSLKEQLSKRDIKLLVILTSTHVIESSRLDQIRKETSLNNRNGLLYLSPEFNLKEINSFALEPLQIIKLASQEFYNSIDKRLRKERSRAISQIESSVSTPEKNAIEIKYCLKVAFINELKGSYDQASKHYETAYENFIDIFTNGYPITSQHWSHFRLLLDIIVFHIVRLNFYLEFPNLAYRKFDIHLKSVLYFLKNDGISVDRSREVLAWLGSQYKWLAQLEDLTPSSLVPSDYPFKFDVTVSNKLSPLLLPHSGYLYMEVVDLLRKIQQLGDTDEFDGLKDPYCLKKSEDDSEKNIINLLLFAKLAFQKRDNTFNRSIAYVNYQIAEEYFKISNFEKAFTFYEMALDSVKEDDWSYLLEFIHFKLFLCSRELKKVYATVLNFLELGLLPSRLIDHDILEDVKNRTTDKHFKEFLYESGETLVINATTDATFDLIESKVLFQDEQISVSYPTILQISLTSKLNEIISSSTLDDLLITFNGDSFPSILIRHDSTQSLSKFMILDCSKLQDGDPDYVTIHANLSFGPLENRVVHLILPAAKHFGTNQINSITATLDYFDLFKVKLNIPVLVNQFERRHVWYVNETKQKIIGRSEPGRIDVVPRIPDVSVKLGELPKVVMIGETVPIDVNIIDEDEEIVDLEAEILSDIDNVGFKWDDFEGGEEKLVLRNLPKKEHLKHVLYLNISQNFKPCELELLLRLTYYINNDHEVPSYKVLKLQMNVINPFKINISIQPRQKDLNLNDFELSRLSLKESSDANGSPKPDRFWLFRLNTFVDSKADIEIVDEEFQVISGHEQVQCIEDPTLKNFEIVDNKVISSHYIETAILDGHTHRNVQLEVLFKLRFKRHNDEHDIISTYLHEPWKLVLPLLDPRVLLAITKIKENQIELKYLIENPTTKLFSFSITLIDSRHFTMFSGVKQLPNLEVQPLEREILIYKLTLNSEDRAEKRALSGKNTWHQLPQLRVYDVNYRVELPTLPITEDPVTQSHKGDIYVLM